MKSQALITLGLISTISISSLPVLASPKVDMATLNIQMQQSVCSQNWEASVKIADQMIMLTPSSNQEQYAAIKRLKQMFQNLSVSKTNVNEWIKDYCATPIHNTVVAKTSSINSSNTSYSGTCNPKLSGTALPMCELVEILIGKEGLQAATVGSVSAEPKVVSRMGRSCQKLLSYRLKSPSSAKFPEEPIIDEIATGVYAINGKVDAQNSYGALIRGDYTCVFRNDSNNETHFVTIDIHTPD